MIIGFLGKGGSGKSTLSFRFVDFLRRQSKTVLAIDADHNMDLAYNLGIDIDAPTTPLIGRSMSEIRAIYNLTPDQPYADIFLDSTKSETLVFKIGKDMDTYTTKWSLPIDANTRIMIAGPHTDGILHGGGCSHTLYTPLKIYLPQVELSADEFVIVDEKAGTDSVGTGITTGFDFAFVCFENTPHSIKAAQQISSMLHFFGTPHSFVLNKHIPEIKLNDLSTKLGTAVFTFPFSADVSRPDTELPETHKRSIEDMLAHAKLNHSNISRREHTIRKFKRNLEYRAH